MQRAGYKDGCRLTKYVLLFSKKAIEVVITTEIFGKIVNQIIKNFGIRCTPKDPAAIDFMTKDELEKTEVKKSCSCIEKLNKSEIYDFKEHLRICEDLVMNLKN